MTRAFPEGLDAARSLRVAKALEPYMSDRSLATMLAWVVDGDPVCYPRYMNTIYASCQLPADDPDLQDVLIRLKSAGLQAWIAEESP